MAPDGGAYVRVDDDGVALVSYADGEVGHALDSKAELHRLAEGGLKNGDLGRAVGAHKQPKRVLDVTGGLGRDACALAAMGCTVDVVERSPVLAALWQDVLERVDHDVVQRLRFQQAEAADALRALVDEELRPQVVLLDPMFPKRKKKALVKKELRAVKALLDDEDLFGDPDAEGSELVALAQQVATERVVVKRPVRAPPLGPVSFDKKGKVLRFDVWLVPQLT